MYETDGSLNITYELYHAIGVRPPCTDDQLTKAYRKAALKYHPDKANGCPEKFQRVKLAYDILKDPIKREFYDRNGDKGLEFLLSEEYKAFGLNDTSHFFGRMCIQTATKPTRIIPYSAFIAAIGIIFMVFINFLDKKLYYSALKTWSWEIIFSLFWFDATFFIFIFGFIFYLRCKWIKKYQENIINSDKFKDMSPFTRNLLVPFLALKSLCGDLYTFLFTVAITACSFVLALSLDDDGNLIKGATWIKIYWPVILFLVLNGGLYLLLSLMTIARYRNPKRLWTERSLILFHDAYDVFANAAFTIYLANWLDSTDRNKITLLCIFSLIYFKILFGTFRIYTQQKWKILDQKEVLLANLGRNESTEDVEAKLRSVQRIFKILMTTSVFFIMLQVAFIHLHIAGYWPNSWSMTLFPILVCIFCSIMFFGCCFPCILTCMDYALPENSFDQYFGPGESVTIIEIISPKFRYGYGFAPVQPRITHRR